MLAPLVHRTRDQAEKKRRSTLPFMVVPSTAGETPVKPIAVWANKTQKSASLFGIDSPLFGATTATVLVGRPVSGGRRQRRGPPRPQSDAAARGRSCAGPWCGGGADGGAAAWRPAPRGGTLAASPDGRARRPPPSRRAAWVSCGSRRGGTAPTGVGREAARPSRPQGRRRCARGWGRPRRGGGQQVGKRVTKVGRRRPRRVGSLAGGKGRIAGGGGEQRPPVLGGGGARRRRRRVGRGRRRRLVEVRGGGGRQPPAAGRLDGCCPVARGGGRPPCDPVLGARRHGRRGGGRLGHPPGGLGARPALGARRRPLCGATEVSQQAQGHRLGRPTLGAAGPADVEAAPAVAARRVDAPAGGEGGRHRPVADRRRGSAGGGGRRHGGGGIHGARLGCRADTQDGKVGGRVGRARVCVGRMVLWSTRPPQMALERRGVVKEARRLYGKPLALCWQKRTTARAAAAQQWPLLYTHDAPDGGRPSQASAARAPRGSKAATSSAPRRAPSGAMLLSAASRGAT